MVANRLRKNLDKLARWRQQEQVACFRAYDADIPEYACAVDVYTTLDGDTWLHVQEYAAPADIPEATTRKRLNDLLLAVREVFAVPRERVAVKTRSTGKGRQKYGHFDHRGEFLLVEEGAAKLQVNLFDYPRHRAVPRPSPVARADGAGIARPAFSTCSATPAWPRCRRRCRAPRRPPASTCRRPTWKWLADNLRENGIGGTCHRIAQADALKWLEADHGTYDVVFCDPPTFSNSKRADDFDVQRRPRAPAARGGGAAGARRRPLLQQQFPPIPPGRGGDRGVRAGRGHQRVDHSAGLRAQPAHPPRLADRRALSDTGLRPTGAARGGASGSRRPPRPARPR